MGLLSWMTGGNHRADDEHCADIVRQYLTNRDIHPEQWTGVKGEGRVRIYAGLGVRAGSAVGFFVKLDEVDMKPVGVVIPKKTGLASYAHHWRKLWTIDHRPESQRTPLFDFMLSKMPGEYQELDAKQLSGDETMNMAMEVSNYAISAMLRNGFSEDDVIEKRPFLLQCAGTAIMLAQVDNMAAGREDVPQELCDASTKAVDRWLDVQFANKAGADSLGALIDEVEKDVGPDIAGKARALAHAAFTVSHAEQSKLNPGEHAKQVAANFDAARSAVDLFMTCLADGEEKAEAAVRAIIAQGPCVKQCVEQ